MKNNKPNKKNKNKITKNIVGNFILWTLIIIISLTLLNYTNVNKNNVELSYSEFLSLLQVNDANKSSIKNIVITGNDLVAICEPDCIFDSLSVKSFNVILPNHDANKIEEWDTLFNGSVKIEIEKITPGFMDYIFQFSPWLLIIAFWFFIMRRMQGGGGQGGGIFSFAKSKAKIISPDNPKVLFKDVM